MTRTRIANQDLRPFHLAVPDADIEDLHARLDRTRWPDGLTDVGWDYGVPVDYLRQLAATWRHDFDWRSAEARLNALPQFVTTIDDQQVHFLHVRSPEPDALPLVLTHGWPGSIFEFLDTIGPLTDPAAHGGASVDAFHLVIPSIPGFGLSGPTRVPGWDLTRVARAWASLMARLGYDRYVAQGGDTGAIVSPLLGQVDHDHVVAVHANGLMAFPSGDPAELERLTESERARLERTEATQFDSTGYAIIQSTRPQTLAYGLTDSPVGQLAWIVEKFREWTDPTHELPEDAVDIELLLANVSLYWYTATAGSSARLYKESAPTWGRWGTSTTPTGVAVFPDDHSIRTLAERDHNIVHWSEFDRGGHFAAMEAPDLLIDDIRTFFRQFR